MSQTTKIHPPKRLISVISVTRVTSVTTFRGLADHGQRVGAAVPRGRISAAQEPAARAGVGAVAVRKEMGMGWDGLGLRHD